MEMITEDLRPEPARRSDAAALARLVVMAGHGMPLLVWEGLRDPGEDVWDVGRRRAAREEGDFSYRKAWVIRREGRVISGLVGYPLIAPTPESASEDVPAMFRPLVALENRAVPSWYVNVLATVPEARGQGVASRLMADAEARARADGFARMSIITGDDNPALRLYRRLGYAEDGRLPVVHDGWDSATREWILLGKTL